jgi:hypothetical protein
MIEEQKTSTRIMLATMVLWTFFIIIGGRSGMDLHGIRHGEVVFGILFLGNIVIFLLKLILGSYVDQKKGVQPEG